ncbi:cytochrome-c oxidase, subunit VIIa [Sistotremastrum niveocremeum HHB9708]|uniref:Cytochrome c oxidase subunit 9, mitochondrial n=2 Tax=Sistotremastraceae TaxID=3402574 RepID=A0A164VNF7_9AGAM|nr:cytochrome-c oxidase, subunit VIIa [Sistotremastrum niveocremeum HHB9708]KZT39388.1 cytochrome-c oxidase, subunit VIIa [Sistotremastrum suecicum HHB10207 ss-3]
MIAPITGKLRKRFITDLSTAMGLAIAGGYGFWYGLHLPSVRRREQFYLNLEQRRKAGEIV